MAFLTQMVTAVTCIQPILSPLRFVQMPLGERPEREPLVRDGTESQYSWFYLAVKENF
jgi:hypothetical protein